ncbi:hypothetical protein GCM10011413_10150 [Pedobacter psychrotolerans]|uniref:Mandelate racemase/muconate lactonizing enzyme N-terminal domain-containing protein n=2 Tax=Pedobacter psychrotolerans TaxID=1843235 RepID=A0ABQ1SNR1_9SPHI|nr:hypothetical protein GCM10011413_10150 [Pedobacter psychrotolerans]
MKQMTVDKGKIIDFDFSRFRLPTYVIVFKPLLFQERSRYIAVLGPDLESGITGYGETPEDALINWNDNLRSQIYNLDLKNEIIDDIRNKVAAKGKII